jgi:Rrf2 family protein
VASLIRLSEAAVLAMHALANSAARPGVWMPASECAKACRASRDHMSKVCKRLAAAGFFKAQRGKQGGFMLAKPAARIRLIEVLRLFDGEAKGLACLVGVDVGGRPGKPVCIFGPGMAALQRSILKYFKETRVSDLAAWSAR